MSYKNLNLRAALFNENVYDALHACYSGHSLSFEVIDKPNNSKQFLLHVDNRVALLVVYFNADGTITINEACGKHTDISAAVAKYIVENCVSDSRKNVCITMKNFPHESFELLKEFLGEISTVDYLVQEPSLLGYSLWRYRSEFGDAVTVKYYSNGTLTIQGKPLSLQSEALCFLNELTPDVRLAVSTTSACYGIPVYPHEVEEAIETHLPVGYKTIPKHLLSILSASLVLKKCDWPVPDFSFVTYPALRALEGAIKWAFRQKNISVNREFGPFFELDQETGNYVVVSPYAESIDNAHACQEISNAYTFFNANRHGLFHCGEVAYNTRLIQNKADADLIVDRALRHIERIALKLK